jgi:hypothetical protein
MIRDCGKGRINQAKKQPSKKATKQKSNQAKKQPSKKATKQKSNQAKKQPSKKATKKNKKTPTFQNVGDLDFSR